MAMQSQRLKEERLIERGEQYQRAIKLYYREHKKYPRDLDDLEETDGVRFLRRRYEDPIGDSGEWRLIHMGTDGRFEDSLLHDVGKDATRGGTGLVPFAPTQPTASLTPDSQVPGGPVPGASGGEGRGTFPSQSPFQSAARARTARESAAPDLARRARYSQGFEFSAYRATDPAEQPGEDGRPDYSKMLPSTVPMDENRRPFDDRNALAQQQSRDPRSFVAPGSHPEIGQAFGGTARTPGSAPGSSTGPSGAAVSGDARALINRLLTSPRPGGIAAGAVSAPQAGMAQVFERGIAGVASQEEEFGLKVYNGKESYNEWEFVYDYRKDTAGRGGMPGTLPGQASQTARSPRGTLGSRGRAVR